MNTDTILVAIGIVIAVISPFFNRWVELHIPDKKTMTSFIKKSLFFILKYVIFTIYISRECLIAKSLDSTLLIKLSIFFFIILLNIIIDIYFAIQRQIRATKESANRALIDAFKMLADTFSSDKKEKKE